MAFKQSDQVFDIGDINKTVVGLGSVDNTSDVDKPVSTAQQTALDLKTNTSVSNTLQTSLNTAIVENPKTTASNVMVDGTLAISNTIETKAFAAVTYTGNGTSQDIVTGIGSTDFTKPFNDSGSFGPNLISNSTFDGNSSTGWGGSMSVQNERLEDNRSGVSAYTNDGVFQSNTKYRVRFNIQVNSGSIDLTFYRFNSTTSPIQTISSSGSHSIIVEDTDNSRLNFYVPTAFDGWIDNITVEEVYGNGYWHDRTTGDCIIKNDAGTIIESGSCVVNTSKVHFKKRSGGVDRSNLIFDSIRGVGKPIYTDRTDSEATSIDELSSFNSDGVTVLAGDNVNGDTYPYIVHQTLYTHIEWGLTSQGKRYICAYNPITRQTLTLYQGSGSAGHQIPNPLGVKLDYLEIKNITTSNNWHSICWILESRGNINLSSSFASGTNGASTTYYFVRDDTTAYSNSLGDTFISYGFANSETQIITPYGGTGASGNFVETKDIYGVARKPRMVVIKRTDSTGNWGVIDTERGDNFVVYPNLSNTEGSSSNVTSTINGLNIGVNGSLDMNTSGGQYIAIVEFDTNAVLGTPDDTYFDNPTDTSNLNVTSGVFTYTDGKNNYGYNRKSDTFTGSVDFSGATDGLKWIGKDLSASTFNFLDKKPSQSGLYAKTSANDNRLVFDTASGKWNTTTGGELVTNGTFDTDISGWTSENGAGITLVNNTMEINDNSPYFSAAYQNITTVIGEEYTVSFDFIQGTWNQAVLKVDDVILLAIISNGTYSTTFIATSTSTKISFGQGSSIERGTIYIDNISVYKKQATLGTPIATPLSFMKNPIQVTSGTPQSIDYSDELATNVMDSLEVSGDVTAGEYKGKNACTAWVNFDGTTTPPNIRDSFNVSDVVRTATGVFDVYFEEPMNNSNYSIQVSSRGSGEADVSPNYQTTKKYQVNTRTSGFSLVNRENIYTNVFGGKN